MEKPCHVSDDCGRTNPFFLYVRNSICKIFFSSEKILVYTICTIYDFTDSGNTAAELYFIRKTKLLNSWKSFDNPCNIFTFWNCMAYFRFPGNPRFYTWCRKNGWRKSATNDSLHYSSKFKTCRYHIIYISIYRKLEYGWTAYPFSRKRNRLSPFCFLASLNQNAVGIQSVCGLLCLLPVTFFFYITIQNWRMD